jgi:transcriptional regulator of arginine metabolism
VGKQERQAQILSLVKRTRVTSQEALRELLAARGTEVTQATLSRDIRELRLVKVTGTDGTAHYSLPDEWEVTPSLASLLPTLFLDAEGVDHLLVVRTLKGAAPTVGAALDWEEWPEVLGTLAGDDTILVVVRDPAARAEVEQRLRRLAGVRND